MAHKLGHLGLTLWQFSAAGLGEHLTWKEGSLFRSCVGRGASSYSGRPPDEATTGPVRDDGSTVDTLRDTFHDDNEAQKEGARDCDGRTNNQNCKNSIGICPMTAQLVRTNLMIYWCFRHI